MELAERNGAEAIITAEHDDEHRWAQVLRTGVRKRELLQSIIMYRWGSVSSYFWSFGGTLAGISARFKRMFKIHEKDTK